MKSIIQTVSPALEETKSFYNKLGFSYFKENEKHYFADSQLVVETVLDRVARPGIQLYKDDWSTEVDALKELTPVYSTEIEKFIAIPGPLWIYLHKGEPFTPEVQTARKCLLGSNNGISIETAEPKRAFELLQILGFKLSAGKEGDAWFCMTDNSGLSISLMAPGNCPHLFFNPSLNYFNGQDNIKTIQKIRDAGIEITEEITVFNKEGIVDNIIIRDPGGYGFFVFSD